MIRITLMMASLFSGTVTVLTQTEESYTAKDFDNLDLYSVFVSALQDFTSCRSLTLCQLLERFKAATQGSSGHSSSSSQDYRYPTKTSSRARSYYNNFAPPAPHAYYPPFDPISVLASLAFLAFLLQSFASLFDRSRSIIPAIVSSRQSSKLEVQDITKGVLRAVDEYELLNEKSSEKNNRGNKD